MFFVSHVVGGSGQDELPHVVERSIDILSADDAGWKPTLRLRGETRNG